MKTNLLIIFEVYYFFIVVIFFIFTFFSTFYFHNYIFENMSILLFLLLLNCTLLILIFFSLKKKNYIIINSIAILFLFIFLFEIYLLTKGSIPNNAASKQYDIFDYIKKKNSYFPIIYPRSLLEMTRYYENNKINFFPLGAVSKKTTVLCNEDNFWTIYNSDRYGFNNNDNLWDEKIKLVIFGDSFSHGNCVLNKDQWVNKLKKTIPNTLNLSMGGNGPLLTLATMREYFDILKPEIIVWQYYESHETRIPLEKKNIILLKYLQDLNFKQNLSSRQNEIDSYLLSIINSKEFITTENKTRGLDNSFSFRIIFKKVFFLEKTRERLGIVRNNHDLASKDLSDILQNADQFINYKAQKYFLYIPSYYSVITKKNSFHILAKEKVIRIAINNNFKIISADLLLKNYSNPKNLYPGKNLHFNKLGYNLVLKAVDHCIKFYNKNYESNFCEPK